jgi:hypothetical protein
MSSRRERAGGRPRKGPSCGGRSGRTTEGDCVFMYACATRAGILLSTLVPTARERVRSARSGSLPPEPRRGATGHSLIASLNTQACRPESVAIYDTAIYIENTRIEHFRAHTFRDCICTSTLDTNYTRDVRRVMHIHCTRPAPVFKLNCGRVRKRSALQRLPAV